jgi:phospholipid/cholesterol/gamma-HCH transport system substrate-binding protein
MWGTILKFGTYAVVTGLALASLFAIFGNYRSGSTNNYSAIFTDASRLKSGDTVRAAGIRVGTVRDVALRPDKKVLVRFDADRAVALTTATKAAVRYLNLTGDRYLELVDSPGSTRVLPVGSQIPPERTVPALNLDLLLGGLKPVIEGLNPQDVNALSASLLQVLQGQGDTLQSLFTKTSSFTNTLGDNSQVVEQVIDNLNSVVDTLSKDGDQFSGTVDRLQKLVSGLAQDRDAIGDAIEALDTGTASIAELLTTARPPLAGTVNQLNRLAPLLDGDKDRLDAALQKAPENYRKLYRIDASRIYVTGLSMGGGSTWDWSAVYGQYAAAIVPVCGGTKPTTTLASYVASKNLPIWGLYSDADQYIPEQWGKDWINWIDARNTLYAPKTKLTIWSGLSHNATWGKAFNPGTKVDGYNIYEWMLRYTRGTSTSGTTATAPTTSTTGAPIANAGKDQSIPISWKYFPTLNATLSTDPDGYIKSFKWTKVSGPSSYWFYPSSTSPKTQAKGLVAGTYVFRVTVTDNSGKTDTDDVTIYMTNN